MTSELPNTDNNIITGMADNPIFLIKGGYGLSPNEAFVVAAIGNFVDKVEFIIAVDKFMFGVPLKLETGRNRFYYNQRQYKISLNGSTITRFQKIDFGSVLVLPILLFL